MRSSIRGFTIIELLIVIVVIAILAGVSIASFNGMQQKARNTQTINAVSAYIDALHLYKVDFGQYPPVNSCLGNQYDVTGCDTGGYVVNGGGFNTSYLSTYLGTNVPMPASNRGLYYTGRSIGGAFYVWNSASYGGTNNGGIGLYYQGSTQCPSVGGLTATSPSTYEDGSGVLCRYGMN